VLLLLHVLSSVSQLIGVWLHEESRSEIVIGDIIICNTLVVIYLTMLQPKKQW